MKRCPNGSRRNKKTKQCVRKSAMKKKRCPNGSRRNRKTKQCVRKSKMKKKSTFDTAERSFLRGIKSAPSSVKKGVITGVKTMQKMEQTAVKTLPRLTKTSRKIVSDTGGMIEKALRDGLITEKQKKNLHPNLLKAIINKKRKKGGKRGG